VSTSAAPAQHPAVAAARVPRWTTPLDAAVAGGLAGWGLLEVALTPEVPAPAGVAFTLACTLPLAVRRRFPGTVMTVVCLALVAHAATTGVGATFTPFPSLLLATFTVAVQVGVTWRAVALGLLPVLAMTTAGQLGYFGPEGAEPRAAGILVFFVGGAWAGGRVVRQRALAALRAERDAGAAAEQAVADERARIARELHDVVAHAVSVVVLQTGAAEQFVERDPQRARRHVQLARRTAGEAMTEMRHLLDVLREGDAGYAPQPGIDRLEELVAEAREAGLLVALDVRGDAPVPDGTSLAVYRLVQESLTNVRKHAPGAAARVEVSVEDTRVRVLVEDDGAGTSPPEPAPGTGHGLPGMRERVRVYGGSLDAGPGPDGGWTVRAELPRAAS